MKRKNKEGYRDDTAEQAIWGVRKEERIRFLEEKHGEERIRFLEEKHGVYRGEKYRLLLDREPSDARTEKLIRKWMTVVIKEVHPHIVTFQDSKGRWESLSWHEFNG